MSVRVYASGDRGAYRLAAAVDAALGWPRDHVDGEPGYHRGRNVRAPGRTETQQLPVAHADGRTALDIDDAIRALHGRAVDVRDGGTVRVTIDATATHEALPGGRTAWTATEPRGGITATRDGGAADSGGGRSR